MTLRPTRRSWARCMTCGSARPPKARSVISRCRLDPSLSVQAVHERVDNVERALRHKFPAIKRVIGHAEPNPVIAAHQAVNTICA